ncbi:hypothetical protein CIB84_004536, partial [Bambusicola thoracicus]
MLWGRPDTFWCLLLTSFLQQANRGEMCASLVAWMGGRFCFTPCMFLVQPHAMCLGDVKVQRTRRGLGPKDPSPKVGVSTSSTPESCTLPLVSAGFFSSVCASDSTDVVGTEGKSVTFHLQNLIGEYLTWSFRGEPILVIRLGAPPKLMISDQSFASRVAFPNNGSSLTISQLTRRDAGTYLAKSDGFKVNFTLHVYRELPEPTVSCAGWNCSTESCRYELRCAVDPPGDSSFYWSYNDWPVSEGPEWVAVVEKQNPEDPDPMPYTCTAQNPVSRRNTTVSPSAVCAGESTRRMHRLGVLGMCWG